MQLEFELLYKGIGFYFLPRDFNSLKLKKKSFVKFMFSVFDKKNWPSLTQKAFSVANIATSILPTIIPESAKKKQPIKRTDYSNGDAQDKMLKALDSLKKHPENSLRATAKKYDVSRKSLSNRLNGTVSINASLGRSSFLTKEEESIIVQHCLDMARLGYGYERVQVMNLVRYYFQDKDFKITDGWWRRFTLRHPEITRRRAQGFDKYRVSSCTETKAKEFFDLLELAYKKCQDWSNGKALTANRIWAADETGFRLNQKQGYIITKRGSKTAHLLTSGNQVHVSVMSCISALGVANDPFFILKGKRNRPNFNKTFFKDSGVSMNGSGWMDFKSFRLWAESFVENIKEIRGEENLWCLVVVDNHSSHCLDPEALEFLLSKQVLLVSIPSHSTSYLMPLDLAVFHPLKKRFADAQEWWKRKNGLEIKIDNFPEVLEKAWDESHSKSNIKAGFTKSGIYPLNKNWVKENKQIFAITGGDNVPKTSIEKLEFGIKKLKEKYEGGKNLLKSCDYLNLSVNSEDVLEPKPKTDLEKMLEAIYLKCEKINLELALAKPKRKNIIQEEPGVPKILNSEDRIEKLKKAKQQPQKKKGLKKRKSDIFDESEEEDEDKNRFSFSFFVLIIVLVLILN